MIIIVGLGNPGKDYANTRHNVGWMVLDKLAKPENWKEDKKIQAAYAKEIVGEKETILLKPGTYMNNSGLAVSKALHKYKLPLHKIIVVHDDKDIVLGEVKIQFGRGSAGHNGVQSIIDQLGSKDFTRIRIGIMPNGREVKDTSDFVISKFSKSEKEILQHSVEYAITELIKILSSDE